MTLTDCVYMIPCGGLVFGSAPMHSPSWALSVTGAAKVLVVHPIASELALLGGPLLIAGSSTESKASVASSLPPPQIRLPLSPKLSTDIFCFVCDLNSEQHRGLYASGTI